MEGAKECGAGGNSGSCSEGIHGYPPLKDNSEPKLFFCANLISLIFLSSLTQTKFQQKSPSQVATVAEEVWSGDYFAWWNSLKHVIVISATTQGTVRQSALLDYLFSIEKSVIKEDGMCFTWIQLQYEQNILLWSHIVVACVLLRTCAFMHMWKPLYIYRTMSIGQQGIFICVSALPCALVWGSLSFHAVQPLLWAPSLFFPPLLSLHFSLAFIACPSLAHRQLGTATHSTFLFFPFNCSKSFRGIVREDKREGGRSKERGILLRLPPDRQAWMPWVRLSDSWWADINWNSTKLNRWVWEMKKDRKK